MISYPKKLPLAFFPPTYLLLIIGTPEMIVGSKIQIGLFFESLQTIYFSQSIPISSRREIPVIDNGVSDAIVVEVV